MARLELLDTSVLLESDITEEEARAGNILNRTRTIARVPGFAKALEAVESAIKRNDSLEPIVKATVIASVVRRSPYELDRLRSSLIDSGLTSDMLEAIEEEDWTESSFSDAQKIAFQFSMMYDAGHGVTAQTYADVSKEFSETQIVELAAICGHYGGLARMAIALSFDAEK